MAELCGVSEWKIGVNAICYRGHSDRIGAHADDDQGETCIASLTVASDTLRKVVIRLKKSLLPHRSGDVEYELLPRPGDVYVMDGVMQMKYTHEVPAVNHASDAPRLAVIFRDGQFAKGTRADSGEAISDLVPVQKRQHRWGRELPLLEEGGLYTRVEMLEREYHMYVFCC